MGMGKTCMISSLILLHSRVNHAPTDNTKLSSKSTLIIVPDTILKQWILELDKTVGNKLSHYIYTGVEIPAEQLLEYDIVFTSYTTLKADFHIIENEGVKRSTRSKQTYTRRVCPLAKIEWWRIVLDEAQMVESTISHASKLAQKLARVNSWAVTGTPLPKTGFITDMQGLFGFLHISIDTLYLHKLDINTLVEFLRFFVHRNTKKNVENELVLPKQSDQTLMIGFKPIESQYYSDLVQQAKDDVGEPRVIPVERILLREDYGDVKEYYADMEEYRHLLKDYESHQSNRLAKIATWLLRLRQTCVHPNVSQANRNILGGHTESMGDILSSMLDKSETAIQTDERQIVLLSILNCHILEKQAMFDESIKEYEKQIVFVEKRIEEMNEKYQTVEKKEKNENQAQELSQLKTRIRLWTELKHRLLFFLACSFHNKGNLEDSPPESQIRKKETEFYEKAEELRSSLLLDFESSVKTHQKDLLMIFNRNQTKFANQIPSFDIHGGIRTNTIFSNIMNLQEFLFKQWDQICGWRAELMEILSTSIENQQDDVDGQEFERGVLAQDKAMAYQDEIFALLMHYRHALSGVVTNFPIEVIDQPEFKALHEITDSLSFKGPKSLKELCSDLKSLGRQWALPEHELNLAAMGIYQASENLDLQCKQMETVERLDFINKGTCGL
jgi:E3 ubiquitin-protein ligase SHPRH